MAQLKGLLYRKVKRLVDGREKEKENIKKDASSSIKSQGRKVKDIIVLVKPQLICLIISVLIAAVATYMLSRYDKESGTTLLFLVFLSSLGTAYVILNSTSSKIILK